MSAYRSKIDMYSQNTVTSPLTLDVGYICRNLLEIHRILSEIEKRPQASSIWKMRMRVDHGHMQFKIVTNRDELSFLPLKIMTFVGNTVTKRDKP